MNAIQAPFFYDHLTVAYKTIDTRTDRHVFYSRKFVDKFKFHLRFSISITLYYDSFEFFKVSKRSEVVENLEYSERSTRVHAGCVQCLVLKRIRL